ncbi:multiple sugar transport system permease protein [Clostridium sp. USBA 49]|jgi:multiple sugar transport system permease protein|uniref:carbohydrate ABC transporter permease n=1 Tax=Clostridium prolinivorans TaxID=2769420 RepID=UPI0009998BE6|nr:sugar ABC transporter permease [Clostridium prolinivorans]SKA85547.1 multiple sugar transport system permease protein [Clostridium sp. USBA 49]
MRISKFKSILFLLPFLLCFIIFWLIPIIFGIWISLNNWNLSTGIHRFIGLKNYIDIFTSGNMYNAFFMKALKNVLIFVLISVPPLVIVALCLALIVDNLPNKLKPVFRTIFFISYSVSVTAVASIFLWLFNGNGGFINNILINLGIISSPINWLNKQPYAWIALVITTIWWTIGYNMMLFINSLNDIDQSLYEAASLDGANFWYKFKSIIYPSIKNVLVFVILTTTIASFNLYGQAKLITAGGPSQSTTTLIMNIEKTVFGLNQLGAGSAMAILMGIIIMLISFLQMIITREKDEIRR